MTSKNLNTASEEEQLAAVEQYGQSIRHISNPSKAVQLAAVKKDLWAIHWIKPGPSLWSDKAIKDVVIKAMLSDIKDGLSILILGLIEDLRKNGCPWPELAAIECNVVKQDPSDMKFIKTIPPALWKDQEVKTEVIRSILKNIKTGGFRKIPELFTHLRNVKCPWPELDVIERSFRASKGIS